MSLTPVAPFVTADFLAPFLALLVESPAARSPALWPLPKSALAAWELAKCSSADTRQFTRPVPWLELYANPASDRIDLFEGRLFLAVYIAGANCEMVAFVKQ